MKKIIIVLMMLFCSMITGAQDNSYELFRITENFYSETDDLEQAVTDEFGDKYQMADWNDILQFGEVIFNWVECMPLTDELAVFVTWDGQHWWDGTNRHFYFQFFEDQEPTAGFLAHDEVGDNLLCLGSWYDVNMPILCKLKDEVFKVTANTYGETEDLDQAIVSEMGENYTLADWSDIKDYENNIFCWATFMNLIDDAAFLITRDGTHFWEGSRHYFVQYFADHQPDPTFLVHEEVGNNFLCLGSWYDLNMHILGVLVESSGINPSNSEILNVFPNPVLETLNIQCKYTSGMLQILDMYGNVILTNELSQYVDVQELTPGIYILQLIPDKEKRLYYRKFIKK